jgi:hypothetical protein
MATRNRYAELMAQYQQAQPFSFFGYPSTYSGGYDVTPYQPYRPYSAPVNLYEDIMAQPTMGGGDRRAIDFNPEWTNLSDEGKAAFYAENPGRAKITQVGQTLFGLTGLGMSQGRTDPDFVARQKLIAQGINPESFAYGPPDPNFSSQASAAARNEGLQAAIAAANASGGGFTANPMSSDPAQQAAVIRQAQAQTAEAQARASLAAQISKEAAEAAADRPGGGGGGGGSQRGGESVGGYSGAAASRAASGQFGMGPGTAGFNSGGQGSSSSNYKGGPISMKNLLGPDPEGPDDGYASLKDGEYVINDKAVKKYGIELMNAINSGKISKGKLRGLLEM